MILNDDDDDQSDEQAETRTDKVEMILNDTQPLWVRFSGPKKAPSSCTYLGPAQVMEVIIIDV